MKLLFAAFALLISVYVPIAQGASNCVTCSSCPDPFSNTSAVSYTACTTGSDTCLKSTIRWPGGSLITKSCVPSSSCSTTNINVFGLGFWLNCCSGDYCNSSGMVEPKMAIMFASLAFLAAFFKFN